MFNFFVCFSLPCSAYLNVALMRLLLNIKNIKNDCLGKLDLVQLILELYFAAWILDSLTLVKHTYWEKKKSPFNI